MCQGQSRRGPREPKKESNRNRRLPPAQLRSRFDKARSWLVGEPHLFQDAARQFSVTSLERVIFGRVHVVDFLCSFLYQAFEDRHFTEHEVFLYALSGVHSTTAPQCSSLKARRRFV